jgi:aspartate aminotransferase-like enzyme/predicted N-acetyltransferase YhbS
MAGVAGSVTFRVAGANDAEAIFRLGYETFVEEIPQHPANPSRRHVDRFHSENCYIVAVDGGGALVGMIAIRGVRPFSLDQKLGCVDEFLPPGRTVCELRLLAVRPEHRRGPVFKGLIDAVVREGRALGFDLAIISGTLRQAKLYRHLGFVPFAHVVGTAEAPFQPLYLTFERFVEAAPALAASVAPVSFLPGPVPIAPDVRDAFAQPPAYHRDAEFRDAFLRTRARLSTMVNAPSVEVFLGSGTLGNEVVAAQLSLETGPGLILTNGEFGDRLADHAARWRLRHEVLASPWGERLPMEAADLALRRAPRAWIWAVASETSTGMWNDVDLLKTLARRHKARLCLDCVSALGAVPLDLSGVFLASGASGKALAAYPGLSFVFYAHDVGPAPDRLPRYLDLGYYAEKGGLPFTQSSNLVAALDAALHRFDTAAPFADLTARSRWLRPRLAEQGWPILVDESCATPAVITMAPGEPGLASRIGEALQRQGLLVAYQSEYLARRHWLQIALMGHVAPADLERLVQALARLAPAGVALAR